MQERKAFHENTISFGPCVGPMTPDKGESWFCEGNGTETLDPSQPFELVTDILCGPCASMREAKVIEENTLRILDEIGAGK